jgi:nanoRNase/pAp phosphatase (c-di-AMP/oligoRNAs hydrolase)
LDLRSVIDHFKIENGGGHKGAIGFRIDREKLADFHEFITELLSGTANLIEKSENS